MKITSFLLLFLMGLLTSPPILTAQDSNISDKNIEMTTEENATAIIRTGEGRIIGKTG